MIQYSGWMVAAALAAVVFTTGANNATTKEGVVNKDSVFKNSEYGRKFMQNMRTVFEARQGLMEFINKYKVITESQANRLKDLMLKDSPSESDKVEIQTIKDQVIADDKKRNDLSQKKDKTDEESKLIQEYATRTQKAQDLLQDWGGKMREEMNQIREKMEAEAQEKVTAAISAAAKAGGFTMIHDSNLVPYAVNNITEEATKKMDSK